MTHLHLNLQITTVANVLGIVGVFLILGTYFLLQIRKLAANKLPYSVLNAVGSGLIFFSLIYQWNLPSAIVEGAWVLISLYGIYRVLKFTKG